MIYIETGSTDVYYNFGLEYYFTLEKRLPDTVFLFWRTTPTLMVGKYQNVLEEINKPYADAHGIHLVRRMSGGGTIYTDMGGWQFTFIQHKEAEEIEFGQYIAPVIDALREMGVRAAFNGRNDITIDGQKFSGNAQYRKQGRIMHHGTLMFDSDLSVVAQALQVSQDKIESKGIPSVRSRVTTIRPYLRQDVSLEQFKALLLEAMFEGTPMEPYSLTTQDLAAVQALRDSRYATWEWNYGASPKWSVRKRRRVEGVGVIEVFLVVEQGRIAAADFRGDYFSAEDSGPLSARLMGLPLEPSALTDALRDVPVDRYFTGLTAEALVCILTQ